MKPWSPGAPPLNQQQISLTGWHWVVRTDYFSCFKNSNDDFSTFHKLFLQLFFLSSYTKNLPFALFGWGYPSSWFVYKKKKKYVATYRNFRLAQRPDPGDMILSPWFVKILLGFLVYLETSQWTAETLIHKAYALCRIAYTLPRGCVSAPHSSSWLFSLAIAVSLDLSSLILFLHFLGLPAHQP